jgi:hypothetical protein
MVQYLLRGRRLVPVFHRLWYTPMYLFQTDAQLGNIKNCLTPLTLEQKHLIFFLESCICKKLHENLQCMCYNNYNFSILLYLL